MCTILLVDDDEACAFATAAHLTDCGHQVISVHSSMMALDILEAEVKIDLVLTDIVLARGKPNGISLARMAHVKRPDIKTVLMTGCRDIAGDESMMPGRLFYKPLDFDKLAQAIEAIISAKV
jgi:DNA-binding NtrC family response regulator